MKSKAKIREEEEKRLNKAYRVIYKGRYGRLLYVSLGGDLGKLTEEAHMASARLKIDPDELMVKN